MKRLLDLLLALVATLLLIVPVVVVAIMVKLTSAGPALYWSDRVGRHNKIFKMPKFRSMQIGTPAVATHLLKDPNGYLTPVGSFLRKSSLDELPQFWNVLRGEMSVVGPRPEELWMVDRYDEATRARLRIKPGITGYQQIRCRGTEDMSVRLNHDLYYIDHQSLFFDLYIILQTLWVVITGKGRI